MADDRPTKKSRKQKAVASGASPSLSSTQPAVVDVERSSDPKPTKRKRAPAEPDAQDSVPQAPTLSASQSAQALAEPKKKRKEKAHKSLDDVDGAATIAPTTINSTPGTSAISTEAPSSSKKKKAKKARTAEDDVNAVAAAEDAQVELPVAAKKEKDGKVVAVEQGAVVQPEKLKKKGKGKNREDVGEAVPVPETEVLDAAPKMGPSSTKKQKTKELVATVETEAASDPTISQKTKKRNKQDIATVDAPLENVTVEPSLPAKRKTARMVIPSSSPERPIAKGKRSSATPSSTTTGPALTQISHAGAKPQSKAGAKAAQQKPKKKTKVLSPIPHDSDENSSLGHSEQSGDDEASRAIAEDEVDDGAWGGVSAPTALAGAAAQFTDEEGDEDDDEQEDEMLHGFSSDADSSDEDMDEAGIDIGTLPTVAKDDATVKRKLERAKRENNQERGVIYLGRVPHGFYEDQMRGYFSQFGDITRLRLSRNKKTGQSKHYGFIEFDSASVAQIVAETMDNYLLMGHLLRCKVVPKEEVHAELWVGANRKWRKVPRDRVARVAQNKPRTAEQQAKAENKLLRRQEGRKRKLAEAEIVYDFDAVAYKKKAKSSEA